MRRFGIKEKLMHNSISSSLQERLYCVWVDAVNVKSGKECRLANKAQLFASLFSPPRGWTQHVSHATVTNKVIYIAFGIVPRPQMQTACFKWVISLPSHNSPRMEPWASSFHSWGKVKGQGTTGGYIGLRIRRRTPIPWFFEASLLFYSSHCVREQGSGHKC